jgi:3-methyladenine DNA glycosylase AlkD
MIKVLGPFLAKNRNEHEVKEVVENWSRSEYLWVRRGSLVIYLKTVMIRKNFSQDFLSELIENFINDSEPYIQKAIAWLLRTCSRYEPKIIFEYLMENKNEFSRLVLREGSKKLLKTQRIKLLEEK